MTDTVEAFFYGLYMDPILIESLGFKPLSIEKAKVSSFALDLFGAARIVPRKDGVVWGNIIELSKSDLEAMYSFESTKIYSQELIQVEDVNGNNKLVNCYNLPESSDEPFNNEYHQKLLNVLKELNFPAEYIESLASINKNQI